MVTYCTEQVEKQMTSRARQEASFSLLEFHFGLDAFRTEESLVGLGPC